MDIFFFLQQYTQGSTAIWNSYAGYLHLAPRVIAWLTDLFSRYTFVPYVYNYTTFFIVLAVTASVFSPRLSVPNKPSLALSIVLVPHYSGEVFLNITNVHWFLCVALIVVLLKDTPDSKYGNRHVQMMVDSLIVIFCGLTGPFIVFLLPLFLLKLLKIKGSYRNILLTAVVITAYIQIITFIETTTHVTNKAHFTSDIVPYLQVLGHRVFGGLFLGLPSLCLIKNYGYEFIPIVLAALYFILLCSLFIYGLKTRNIHALALLVIHCVFVLVSFYRVRSDPTALAPLGNGARYFYIPYLTMAWTFITLLPQHKGYKHTLISLGLGLILLSSLTSKFQSEKFVDYQWAYYSQMIGQQQVIIPINPPNWHITVPAKTGN